MMLQSAALESNYIQSSVTSRKQTLNVIKQVKSPFILPGANSRVPSVVSKHYNYCSDQQTSTIRVQATYTNASAKHTLNRYIVMYSRLRMGYPICECHHSSPT